MFMYSDWKFWFGAALDRREFIDFWESFFRFLVYIEGEFLWIVSARISLSW